MKKMAMQFLSWIKVWKIMKKFEEGLRKNEKPENSPMEDLRENPLNKDL